MEKTLWIAIAVLWTCLIGGAAFGETTEAMPATGGTAADVMAVSSSVASPANLVSPVRNVTLDVARPPVIEVGRGGGAEMCGAFTISVLLLRAARRRRII